MDADADPPRAMPTTTRDKMFGPDPEESLHMPAHHGNTPAAWTGVVFVLIGFVVGGIGLVVDSMVAFWVGVALAPVGVLVGKVMQRMGLGAERLEH